MVLGRLHRTGDGGEPSSSGPVRGKGGARSREPLPRHTGGDPEPCKPHQPLRPNGAEDLRVALTARSELAEDRIATTLDRLATERDAGRRLEPESAAAR